jgi:hypothetical protein
VTSIFVYLGLEEGRKIIIAVCVVAGLYSYGMVVCMYQILLRAFLWWTLSRQESRGKRKATDADGAPEGA